MCKPWGRVPFRVGSVWLLGLLLCVEAGGLAWAAPDPNWSVQFTLTDCSGAAQQNTPACDDYATDLYEHLDYSDVPSARTADLRALHTGYDADYYYFEADFVGNWSQSRSPSHQFVLEFDVDVDTETSRGDYYVGIFQKSEFDSTSWVDAYVSGGFDSKQDSNDDVGGADPIASDFGGSPGDGYNADVTQGSDQVWARIVGGNFQIAVKRSLIGSPAELHVRTWSRQSTSLSPDKLYFHDQNNVTDVSQIDNVAGLPSQTEWISVGPGFLAELVKRGFQSDGTAIPDSSTLPAGTRVKFLLYINNSGSARTDVSIEDVLDATFAYQSGTIKVDNSVANCALNTCTAAEETTIFNSVDGQAAGTDAVDGDTVSYTAATTTIDAGNQNQANAQLDIAATRVLAVLFTVKM